MILTRSIRQDWRRGVCPGAKEFHAAYHALIGSATIRQVGLYRVSSVALAAVIGAWAVPVAADTDSPMPVYDVAAFCQKEADLLDTILPPDTVLPPGSMMQRRLHICIAAVHEEAALAAAQRRRP